MAKLEVLQLNFNLYFYFFYRLLSCFIRISLRICGFTSHRGHMDSLSIKLHVDLLFYLEEFSWGNINSLSIKLHVDLLFYLEEFSQGHMDSLSIKLHVDVVFYL